MGSEGPGRGFGSGAEAERERDIDDLPRNHANHTALTPLWFLERAALAQPDRASLVHGPVRYTWADTYRRCRRLASALARRSVGHGSTVNFLSPVLSSFPPMGFSPRVLFPKEFIPSRAA
jgi:non-ribosomal peptide synthetase component F